LQYSYVIDFFGENLPLVRMTFGKEALRMGVGTGDVKTIGDFGEALRAKFFIFVSTIKQNYYAAGNSTKPHHPKLH
jgi:hypothetical protein